MAEADVVVVGGGTAGAVVADASLMPVVPRATTHMPTTVTGERIAASLLEER